MSDILQALRQSLDLTHAWWTWRPESASVWDGCYRGFNLVEGLIWLLFSGLVVRRWYIHRQSRWEWLYAAVFAIFGLTDFREAWEQSLGLVIVKGLILGILLSLRHRSIRVWYPGSMLY